MSIIVELTTQEIATLKELTKLEGDAEAVAQAAREFLRFSRLRELKAACGKVAFEANLQGLEDLELLEADFPQ
jgi:hypothetical protein